MLDAFFESPGSREWLRSGPAGAHVDDFARRLMEKGYGVEGGRRHLYAANKFACWGKDRGLAVSDLDEGIHDTFCWEKKTVGYSAAVYKRLVGNVRRFVAFLRSTGVLTSAQPCDPPDPPLFQQFRQWMRNHRGVLESTVDAYRYAITDLLKSLGDDPQKFNATQLRQFVIDRSRRYSVATTQGDVMALRMFMRFLSAVGKCRPELVYAMPNVAKWSLSSLPKYLQPEEVEKVIAASDPATRQGARNRAIILLLARLGLRAAEVAKLKLSDVNWKDGTLTVSGKHRRVDRIRLPSEVGNAVRHYLEKHRPTVQADQVFIRLQAPLIALTGTGVSQLAGRAILKAGIEAPSFGAHLLRHSAATGMLRQGASLQHIGSILRHALIDTTAQYAKVDVDLLKKVVRPWPEVEEC